MENQRKNGKTVCENILSITHGMANAMGKGSEKCCPVCNMGIPKYPGRYPKYCPNCGSHLTPEDDESNSDSE